MFNWDEDQTTGTGTLREFFEIGENPVEEILEQTTDLSPEKQKEFREMMGNYAERDKSLAELMLEWAVMCGLNPDDQISAESLWSEDREVKDIPPKTGIFAMIYQPDDAIYSLWKDGEILGAYYASFRGFYQAGCYVKALDKSYFAHDCFEAKDFRDNPEFGEQNKWHEWNQSTCGDIAKEFCEDVVLPEYQKVIAHFTRTFGEEAVKKAEIEFREAYGDNGWDALTAGTVEMQTAFLDILNNNEASEE